MEEYKKILKIAAYLLEYPDAAWWEEFSEYRAAAQELENQQTREVFHDSFDYVEGVGAKEYEQDYVRKFDFSQNTNLYLTTHNRTDFGKQSTEMHDFKQLFLDNGYDLQNLATENEDVRTLRELITYGIKGMAVYLYHANALDYDDEKIAAFMQSTLAKLLDDSLSGEDLTALALETGKVGVEVIALLDKANTQTYGNPEISKVNLGVGKNPAILVSGHDLRDLEHLLEQTTGTGVDVYTHGEMLPAHYYPKLKKFKHLVGNYGNAWQLQTTEFEKFNGAILLTTNYIHLGPTLPAFLSPNVAKFLINNFGIGTITNVADDIKILAHWDPENETFWKKFGR